MDSPILVTGATGTTGRAVTAALLERGVPVRAMARSAASLGPGVEPAGADFDDPGSVAAALAGVRRAYLVTPSSERAQAQQVRFAELAAAAGVEHLVVLSQLGAAAGSPVRFLRYHAAVEDRVRELGLPYTFLRPNLFFQAMLALAGPIAAGRLFAPIGAARVSAVDVRDIGAVAAAALTEPGHEGRTYTLTGPAGLTHADLAAALGAELGRPVEFTEVPPAAFGDALAGVLPPWQVEGTLEDYAHYGRGEAAAVEPDVPAVLGRPAIPFADFVRDHAEQFAAG